MTAVTNYKLDGLYQQKFILHGPEVQNQGVSQGHIPSYGSWGEGFSASSISWWLLAVLVVPWLRVA